MTSLTVLSLADCGLVDLDGLAAFPSLRELRLANNSVADLDPLFHHECLQVLDCRANACATLMALEVLGTCALLYRLELAGNPVAACFEASTYRRLVCHHIPSLKVLDGKHLPIEERVELDDDELLAAAEALDAGEAWAAPHAQASPAVDSPPAAKLLSSRDEPAPWQAVLGSKRRSKQHGRRKAPAPLPAVLLEQDPNSSRLTLDHEAFSGSALAIMRRRAKPLAAAPSVLDTLDDAMAMDKEAPPPVRGPPLRVPTPRSGRGHRGLRLRHPRGAPAPPSAPIVHYT